MRLAICGVLVLCFAPELRADESDWRQRLEAGNEAIKQGRYAAAQTHIDRAVKEAARFGKSDWRLGVAQTAQARLALKRGRYAEADQLCQQAQSLLEAGRDKESRELAACLDVHGQVLGALGANRDAKQIARRAYEIRRKALGREHEETIQSIDTLAMLDGAFDVIRGEGLIGASSWDVSALSLKVRERKLGKDHPDVAASLIAQSVHSWATRERRSADLARALTLLIKAHGLERPDVADCLTLLADSLATRGKFKESEEIQQLALAIWKGIEAEHPRAAPGLYNLALAWLARGRHDEAYRVYSEAVRWQFRWLTDEELCRYFLRVEFKDGWLDHQRELTHGEAYLLEMQRRGGKMIERFLTQQHREHLAQQLGQLKRRELEANNNLEILTTLRRIQNRRDPLTVSVKGDPEYVEAVFPSLPIFHVELTNVDEKGESFGIKQGGDYRSGRKERWRFEVRDAHGRVMPVKPLPLEDGFILAGGTYGLGVLKAGKSYKSWPTSLNMNEYSELPPGDYVVTIVYHNDATIADRDWTGGLVVLRSKPIRLHVQPRVIDISRSEAQEIRAAIAKLEDSTLRLAGGPLPPDGKAAFYQADTPEHRIVTKRWKAVPALIDSLADEKISAKKRAWLIGLLHSITGLLDPTKEDNVMPLHDWLRREWAGVYGGNLSATWEADARSYGGNLGEKKQKDFARRWEAYRNFIIVRQQPESPSEKTTK